MATLDSILGKFSEVKDELITFIHSTKEEIKEIGDTNLVLAEKIRENESKASAKAADIKTASRSINQINKLIGR